MERNLSFNDISLTLLIKKKELKYTVADNKT